jgi:hypothetical protein
VFIPAGVIVVDSVSRRPFCSDSALSESFFEVSRSRGRAYLPLGENSPLSTPRQPLYLNLYICDAPPVDAKLTSSTICSVRGPLDSSREPRREFGVSVHDGPCKSGAAPRKCKQRVFDRSVRGSGAPVLGSDAKPAARSPQPRAKCLRAGCPKGWGLHAERFCVCRFPNSPHELLRSCRPMFSSFGSRQRE